MQGQGHHQPVTPPPPTGLLVFLRVLFVAVALGSIGFLMWVPMLRLAIVTRKAVDWVIFALSVVLLVVSVALLLSEPDDEVDTVAETVGVLLLLITLFGVVSYYLAADIRHFDERRRRAEAAFAAHGHGNGHGSGHGPTGAYGYPQNTGPYGYPVLPQQQPGTWSAGGHTAAPHHTPAATHTPGPHHTATPNPTPAVTPTHTPPPTTPVPGGRIDQVRAELDELSELLRKQDGGPEDAR
jgi:hypothetical protein